MVKQKVQEIKTKRIFDQNKKIIDKEAKRNQGREHLKKIHVQLK
jgi:hypothetical protein